MLRPAGFSSGRGDCARGGRSAGRCSALTRRYVGVDDGFVNCGPSKCRVWPVLAPAGGIVRAGAAVFRAEAAGSVAGMDVFSPKSRKVRQPGLPVGESDDHRRTDESASRDAAFMLREKTHGAA